MDTITSTAILILGMHRSGTSALTGALALLGVELGQDLLPPAPDNPKGFFEHQRIWRVHQELLEALGSEWDDLRPLPTGWLQHPATQEAAQKLQAIIKDEFSENFLWAIKDPRLSRLLPIWQRILTSRPAKAIILLRDPREAASSLMARDGLSAGHALGLWMRYNLDAIQHTNGMARAVVCYHDLLYDWEKEVTSLRNQIGLNLPILSEQTHHAVSLFLEQGLRRQKVETDQIDWPIPLLEQSLNLFGLINTLRQDYENGSLIQRITQIGDKFNESISESTPIYGQVYDYLQRLKDKKEAVAWLEDEKRKITLENARLEKEKSEILSEKTVAIDWLEQEKRKLFDWAQEEKHNRELRDVELVAARRDFEETLSQLTKVAEQLGLTRGRLTETESKLAGLEVRLSEMVARHSWTESQLTQARTELSSIYDSQSWRLTKPLRLLKSALRHPFKSRMPISQSDSSQISLPLPQRHLNQNVSVPLAEVSVPPDETDSSISIQKTRPATLLGAKILLVTPDLHGPIRNGGIGTAFTMLAGFLADAGAQVSILYALGNYTEGGENIQHWVNVYHQQGIRLIPLPSDQSPIVEAPHLRVVSWRVDRWLRQHANEFATVVFPEWMGIAYYALLAKGQGLAYHKLCFIVNTHSPEAWALEGNRSLPDNPDAIDRDFMERESVRRADIVVSPSAYLLRWMKAHQWQLPQKTYLIPNLIDKKSDSISSKFVQPEEIVFFGRLELRKGLKLFCDALDRLSDTARGKIRNITFLGKPVIRDGFNSDDYIRLRCASWGTSTSIISDKNRDEAIAYLHRPGVLCVIPSLLENSPYTVVECLVEHIPFLASRVGGIPELVHEDDQNNILFEPVPSALSEMLERVLNQGLILARPAFSQEDISSRWIDMFKVSFATDQLPIRMSTIEPLVSVCLVHYNRPHLLAQAIESLRQQTYSNFEVVLVDDGSPSLEAKTYLNALTEEFSQKNWRIIRQNNRYLGAARNQAAVHANGKYLLFMDDDNLAMPNEIETFVRAAEYSDADILTTPSALFLHESPPATPDRIWLPLGGAAGSGVFRNVYGDANALWKRAVFNELGGYSEDYGIGHEDWELFSHAVLSGYRLELVPEPLFWYRINRHGMLRTGDVWADHSRSIRPYQMHDPSGLGMAAAYAICLQQIRMIGAAAPNAYSPALRKKLWIILSSLANPHLRNKATISLRCLGWRGTLAKVRYFLSNRAQ